MEMMIKANVKVLLAMTLVCFGWYDVSAKNFSPGKDLNKIVNYSNVDVEYKYGAPNVEIVGPDSEVSKIKLEVSKGCLTISAGDPKKVVNKNVRINGWMTDVDDLDAYESMNKIKIMVSAESVDNFVTYGSGDIKIDRIEGEGVSLKTLGSGDISVGSVKCSGLNIGICGSGDISVGSAESVALKILVQGSGDVAVKSLNASGVEAIVQGSGDISMPDVDAASLRVLGQGSGDIRVGGSVSTAVLTVQGSGDIFARSLKAVKTTKIQHGSGDIYN